ncbi:MAG: ABC transporter ATP-binding protein, partial [Acidimicrobiia bacterium]|nr:ABC transporter ATP-binding protein [Acidimicrobiia bacterium]
MAVRPRRASSRRHQESGTVRLGTSRVGLVFQEAFLFAESLRYNLTLG